MLQRRKLFKYNNYNKKKKKTTAKGKINKYIITRTTNGGIKGDNTKV